MVKAVRSRLAARGLDPRTHASLSYGGCGALFTPSIAAAIGSPRVLIPELASVLSAFGAATADVRRERLKAVLGQFPMDPQFVEKEAAELKAAVARGSRRRRHRVRAPSGRLRSGSALPPPGVGDPDPAPRRTPRRGGDEQPGGCVPRRIRPPLRSWLHRVERPDRVREPPRRRHRPHAQGDDRRHGSAGSRFRHDLAAGGPAGGVGRPWSRRPTGRRRCTAATTSIPGRLSRGPALVDGTDTTIWVPEATSLRVSSHGTLVVEGGT